MRCLATLGVLPHVLWSATQHVSAATNCPSKDAITNQFLKTIKASKANTFVPSIYFGGSAVKLVSASGMRDITHEQLCVDGETSSTKIFLYDDGTHGDDVPGDGIYTRACVHFCQSFINYNDIWNFAYQQNFMSADLTVVKPGLKGQIPHHVVRSPKYPKARIFVTSHAAFFVDDLRHYMPTWPIEGVSHTTLPLVDDKSGPSLSYSECLTLTSHYPYLQGLGLLWRPQYSNLGRARRLWRRFRLVQHVSL